MGIKCLVHLVHYPKIADTGKYPLPSRMLAALYDWLLKEKIITAMKNGDAQRGFCPSVIKDTTASLSLIILCCSFTITCSLF